MAGAMLRLYGNSLTVNDQVDPQQAGRWHRRGGRQQQQLVVLAAAVLQTTLHRRQAPAGTVEKEVNIESRLLVWLVPACPSVSIIHPVAPGTPLPPPPLSTVALGTPHLLLLLPLSQV
jgi:enterochelin esterase-like enzyme